MIPAVVFVIVVYSLIVGGGAVVVVIRRTGRPRWFRAGIWTLQALLTGQALLALLAVIRAGGPARPALFLAYLAVNIALLPLCGVMGTTDGRVGVRADASLAVAAIVVVVVQWRLIQTWRGSSA